MFDMFKDIKVLMKFQIKNKIKVIKCEKNITLKNLMCFVTKIT